ncbi:MAG: hypothetical protein ACI4FX_10880 [Agathobacter sp.]
MQKLLEKILEKLECISFQTDDTYDEDGYSNDDSKEVVRLDFAKETIEETFKEFCPEWVLLTDHAPEVGRIVKVWLSFSNEVSSYVKRAIWVENHFEYENRKVVSEIPVAWMEYIPPEPYREEMD